VDCIPEHRTGAALGDNSHEPGVACTLHADSVAAALAVSPSPTGNFTHHAKEFSVSSDLAADKVVSEDDLRKPAGHVTADEDHPTAQVNAVLSGQHVVHVPASIVVDVSDSRISDHEADATFTVSKRQIDHLGTYSETDCPSKRARLHDTSPLIAERDAAVTLTIEPSLGTSAPKMVATLLPRGQDSEPPRPRSDSLVNDVLQASYAENAQKPLVEPEPRPQARLDRRGAAHPESLAGDAFAHSLEKGADAAVVSATTDRTPAGEQESSSMQSALSNTSNPSEGPVSTTPTSDAETSHVDPSGIVSSPGTMPHGVEGLVINGSAGSEIKMECDTTEASNPVALDVIEVHRPPDSPTVSSTIVMEDPHGVRADGFVTVEAQSSPVHVSPDNAGSPCTDSPSEIVPGSTEDSSTMLLQDSCPDINQSSIKGHGNLQISLDYNDIATDNNGETGVPSDVAMPFTPSLGSSSAVGTIASRPLNLGIALRSAPVNGPLSGHTSDGRDLADVENSTRSNDGQCKSSPPRKKSRQRVRWVEDDKLAEIHFIDTRMQLIQNWDPESEITLPFAPATLAQLRAQVKAQESGTKESERAQSSAAPPLRSAPPVNEFEIARRREREMELERARQAKQLLQARLDAMMPKCDWRSPLTIILPSECRAAQEGSPKSEDEGENGELCSDHRIMEHLPFRLSWMSSQPVPRTQPSPPSPPPSENLEAVRPAMVIPVKDASFNSSQIQKSDYHDDRPGAGMDTGQVPSSMKARNSSLPQHFESKAGSEDHSGKGFSQQDVFRGRPSAVPSSLQTSLVPPFPGSFGPNPVASSMPAQHIMNSPMPNNVNIVQGMSSSGMSGLSIHPQALQQLLAQMRQDGRGGSGMPGMPPPGPHPFPPGMMPQLPIPPLGMGMPHLQMMSMPPPHLLNMPSHPPQNHHPMQQQNPQSNRSRKVCRYFNSKQGCRDGPNCAFLHIAPNSGAGSGGGW
jgi:hypothetical protein